MASQPSFAISGARTAGWRMVGMGAVLFGAGIFAYLPAIKGGFLWDDDSVLSQNGLIQAADGLRRIWTTAAPTDYWPVTNSLFWIEWRLWGVHPLGYHLASLVLHLAGAGLLWAILRRLLVPGAWLAALIFAVHPVNVESVAWIAEQKNLVAMLFFLASIGCFLKAGVLGRSTKPWRVPLPEGSGSGHGFIPGETNIWYWLSLLAFVLAMLSKGSVAMLPFILLGLVGWRRRPSASDVLSLVPFFLVAAALVGVDIWFQKHGSPDVIRHAGWLERLLGAGGVVWFYLSKALWPANLIFVYPQWRIDPRSALGWIPFCGVLAMTVLLFWLARLRGVGRAALFAWGYFCVMLVPVMGFTDVVFMKYSLVADRYQHLAIIGVIAFMASIWGGWRTRASDLGRQTMGEARTKIFALPGGYAPRVAAIVAVGLLAAMTWRQSWNYRDPQALFRATIERNPECWMAYDNLGVAAFNTGRVGEAIARYEQALRIRSDLYETHNYLGNALQAAGRLPEAIAHYREALRLKPDYAEAHDNLGAALARSGEPAAAILQIEEALRLRPDFPEAENNLGTVLAASGRWREALGHFKRAVRLKPDYGEARKNLAAAMRELQGARP